MDFHEVGADVDNVGAIALEEREVGPILGEVWGFDEEGIRFGPGPWLHAWDWGAVGQTVGGAAEVEEVFIGDDGEVVMDDGSEQDGFDETG